MKLALISAALILFGSSNIALDSPGWSSDRHLGISDRSRTAGCGCGDVSALKSRLKGVDAALALIAAESGRAGRSEEFDPSAFDSGFGERITETLLTSGGMGSLVLADIDRNSCEITSAGSLANTPGVPAGFGGSACLTEAATVGLDVRRRACLTGRNASNEESDYWERRSTSQVLRELTEAYTAEASFIRQKLTALAASCGSRTPVRKPVKNLCDNCIQYMFDAKRTLPVVGTIRMWADEMIPFDVKPDRTISGWGTINTNLDTSGSPCRFSGYNGAADFDIGGNISGGNLNIVLTPRGTSQTVSAAMSIMCPPGEAHTYPASQSYTVREQLKVPMAGQDFTEKTLDVGSITRGAMEGEIIIRLFMKRTR